jgi:hypothetical protein
MVIHGQIGVNSLESGITAWLGILHRGPATLTLAAVPYRARSEAIYMCPGLSGAVQRLF